MQKMLRKLGGGRNLQNGPDLGGLGNLNLSNMPKMDELMGQMGKMGQMGQRSSDEEEYDSEAGELTEEKLN